MPAKKKSSVKKTHKKTKKEIKKLAKEEIEQPVNDVLSIEDSKKTEVETGASRDQDFIEEIEEIEEEQDEINGLENDETENDLEDDTEELESEEEEEEKEEVIDEKDAIKHNPQTSHQKRKQTHERIEEGLNAIYGKEKVDFSKVDRKHTRLTSILLTVVITLSVVALAVLTAFFVYQKYFSAPSDQRFEISINAPEELVSGEKTSITINYKNPTNVPLADLQIDAKLPTAFHMQEATPGPSNIEDLIWEIGSLQAGSDQSITIEGVWIAEVPSSTPIQVFANYRPSNFNSDFQAISTVYVNTVSSTLATVFDGKEEGQPGETLEYEFTIENTGNETLETVEASLVLPNGFFLETSKPEIEAGKPPVWKFDVIESEAIEKITFSGSFAADTEGFQYFDINISIADENRSLPQTHVQGFTDVVGDNLSLQLVANGSTNNVTAKLGENVRIAIAIENTGENIIENASLLLDFQADKSIPLIWNDAELDGGAITSAGILWSNSALGKLTPGQKRTLNLTFPLRDALTNSHADTFQILAATTVDGLTVKSTPITLSINTQATFAASARYYTDNGAPLGIGPMPPQVGNYTTYRVVWSIDNDLHDLDNVRVQALLPPHVTWKNQFDVDLGNITFDEDSRMVVWNITQLPKNISHLDATFSISINPDGNDVGTFVKLMSGSTMTAKDTVTNATLTTATESITTELPEDPFADGKGIVVDLIQ